MIPITTSRSSKFINCIVAYLYRPVYSAPTYHETKNYSRDSYQPLFNMYGVDLVLQANNHNYQRSYPLRYNAANSSTLLVDNQND